MFENLIHVASTDIELQHTKHFKMALLKTVLIGDKPGFPRDNNILYRGFLLYL